MKYEKREDRRRVEEKRVRRENRGDRIRGEVTEEREEKREKEKIKKKRERNTRRMRDREEKE